MAESKDMAEKDLIEVQSFDWIRGLLGDNSRKMAISVFKEMILGTRSKIGITMADGDGGGLLEPSVGIVFAYDSNDISKYLIYAYIRNVEGIANRIILASNILSLGAQNGQGTSVVNGGDTQICLFITK